MPGLVTSLYSTAPQPVSPAIETIGMQDIESTPLLTVVAAWRKWRGLHAMPRREQIALRDLGMATRHISLVRVIDDGEDYEFRIIGDAHVQAYGTSFQNKQVSDVIDAEPRFGKQLKASYDLVRITKRPYALRGTLGSLAQFSWFETCYLPFGTDDVDHIVNAAVYGPYI